MNYFTFRNKIYYMDAINRENEVEFIQDLKNKYNYDNLKAESYHKNSIKDLIIYRLLRVRHHYFYLAYDTSIAIFIILLVSMFAYCTSHETSFVFIFASFEILLLLIIGFFTAISKTRERNLLKEFESHF